jgi:hypothetical protein
VMCKFDPPGPFWLWKVPNDHPSYMPDPNSQH